MAELSLFFSELCSELELEIYFLFQNETGNMINVGWRSSKSKNGKWKQTFWWEFEKEISENYVHLFRLTELHFFGNSTGKNLSWIVSKCSLKSNIRIRKKKQLRSPKSYCCLFISSSLKTINTIVNIPKSRRLQKIAIHIYSCIIFSNIPSSN